MLVLAFSLSACGGDNRFVLTEAENINVGGEALKNLVIEEGITELYDELFSDVTSIETLTLPQSLLKVGSDCFNGCVNVKDLTVPKDVISADFCGMSGLETVYIAAKNAKIFLDSYNAKITVGKTVEALGGNVSALKSIDFESGSVISEIGEGLFSRSNINSIDLPDSVRVIGDNAFWDSDLTNIELPAELTPSQAQTAISA